MKKKVGMRCVQLFSTTECSFNRSRFIAAGIDFGSITAGLFVHSRSGSNPS
jgi:hypothetical protein